jgi:hypothetical protein
MAMRSAETLAGRMRNNFRQKNEKKTDFFAACLFFVGNVYLLAATSISST